MLSESSIVDLASPALWQLLSHKGPTVVDAKLVADYMPAEDAQELRLIVTHTLLSQSCGKSFFAPPNIHLFGERMKKALLVKEREAKTVAIHRRRMLARANEARKLKPRIVKEVS